MKANVVSTVQKIPLEVISDPKQVAAAETGELFVGTKPVLIVRNGNTETMAAQVYQRFAKEVDTEGAPFEFSRKLKGLSHTDPLWKSRKRVSSSEMEEYIASFFQFAEKVSSPAGEVLILTDRLPKFFTALIQKGRYIGRYVDLFRFVD
jgi:hypothetical protein